MKSTASQYCTGGDYILHQNRGNEDVMLQEGQKQTEVVDFNLERYDEAIQYLELAYANFNDPEVIYHLVKAYQIIGPSNLYLHYKELLLNNYPNSYFSKLLQ